ncbi:Ppx/GppA phosphatase [Pseudomassariella vexata]|uniref:Ppx/GppA phosphatase n=1 Tax=Pseudomassariella vexata TaxID=1141098 RepID=A0A1Y2DT06_9PEZI|nr:Ppx/GppA phosphatase [Pseudomassariella vexata]ORY62276.1 Ppx/GppA phosphatase [Pseudomassariella vexata]
MASVTDLITLENFKAKMPRWKADLPNHLYAVVDMGSNGIRFSISDLSPPQARLLRCVYRERAGISLFDALNSSPSSGPLKFPPEIITQVSHTLARFKSIADAYGVLPEHISVFATEAMRKAENAASMLDAIRSFSGLGVHVLVPEVETLFGAMGARSGFADVKGLFLDLGGGSVQMTYMDSAVDGYEVTAAQSGESMPFGAARLIKLLDSGEAAAATAKSDLLAGMRSAFAKLQQKFPSLKTSESSGNDGIDVYLCGGGFRGYGNMLMHNDPIQPYPIPGIGAYTVTGSFFRQTKKMLNVNKEHGEKIFGMSKRRRQQFPAIATVVQSFTDVVPNVRTVTFCSGGNREGALLLKLPKEVMDTQPLTLLHQPGDKSSDIVIQSVIDTILSSVPTEFDPSKISTIFTLGLGPLFIGKIWGRSGEASDANSAYELHQAITRDPSVPGFTHLARAVLGLTLCARWGSTLGPIDKHLYNSLRGLAFEDSPEANFWADYFGAVASVIATVCPAEPKRPYALEEVIKFTAKLTDGKKRPRIELTISLSADAAKGLDVEDLASTFQSVGKYKKDATTVDRKVEVAVVLR